MRYLIFGIPVALLLLRKMKQSGNVLTPVTVPPNNDPIIGPDNFNPVLPDNTTPIDITTGPVKR